MNQLFDEDKDKGELEPDPDVLEPDDPETLQPDHDESLNPGILPDDMQTGTEDDYDGA